MAQIVIDLLSDDDDLPGAAPAPAPAPAPDSRLSLVPASLSNKPAPRSNNKRTRTPEPHPTATETVDVRGDDHCPESDIEIWRGLVARSGGSFVDADFPPESVSISGKEAVAAPAAPPPPPDSASATHCRCGAPVGRAEVRRDTCHRGRAYLHCAERKCGFFAWADGGSAWARGGTTSRLRWDRLPPSVPLVTDYGFRAADLTQGGVGDCWFMSALAVVAERHDLIARLFAAGTTRNAAGCYCVQLFLDGEWTSVLLDDMLPMTETPRRAALAFDGLAFCRCSSADGRQQLWASLVEKAYAKAHGSYQAISGGMVAEALLELQPPATARNRPQPPATARNRPQPPTTACNRPQPPATAHYRPQPPATAPTACTQSPATAHYRLHATARRWPRRSST